MTLQRIRDSWWKYSFLFSPCVAQTAQTEESMFKNVAYRATIYRTGGCSDIPYQSNRFGDSKCVFISYYFATYVSEVKILLF